MRFIYRYWNSGATIPSTSTTFDEGGDCHMGRAPTATTPPATNCTLLSKNDSWLVLYCNGNNVTLARPKSPSATVQLQSQTRTRCGSCQAPPPFQSPNGTAVPAEVSYGQLWRWAPARLLARDLRFRMCGNGTKCPQSTGWTLSTFWAQMRAPVDKLSAAVGPDPPNSTWDQPWLLCTTNSSGSVCSGHISKQQWLAGNRTKDCLAVLNQSNTQSAAVGVTICELDNNMDELCTLIQHARYQIFEANCQLSGLSILNLRL